LPNLGNFLVTCALHVNIIGPLNEVTKEVKKIAKFATFWVPNCQNLRLKLTISETETATFWGGN